MRNDEFARDGVVKTYRRLRYLAAGALILMPLITALTGWTVAVPLQPSLSDYYFALRDGGLPRALFIIFLAVLGATLLSYRGLDRKDNLIHNAAGAFALGVALFPTACDPQLNPYCVPGLFSQARWLHILCAGSLFAAALLSVLYCGGPRLAKALNERPDRDRWLRRRRGIQWPSLSLMVIGIAIFVVHKRLPPFSWIFWVEYLGFLGFGLYWVRLMWLINVLNEASGASAGLRGPSARGGAPDAQQPELIP